MSGFMILSAMVAKMSVYLVWRLWFSLGMDSLIGAAGFSGASCHLVSHRRAKAAMFLAVATLARPAGARLERLIYPRLTLETTRRPVPGIISARGARRRPPARPAMRRVGNGSRAPCRPRAA